MPDLPEIVFASSDPAQSRRIRKWVKENLLRPLIPRVYTANFKDAIEDIVRKNIWNIVAGLFPGALVSHRSALEHKISAGGNIYLTASNRRVYKWPGVTVRISTGLQPLQNDLPYYNGLFVSSFERACLENLTPSRMIEGEKKIVDQSIIENRLLDELNTRGEEALNQFRDTAREVAATLGLEKEFAHLNQIVASLRSTHPATILQSKRAAAQVMGEPYDSDRLELFHLLAAELKTKTFIDHPTKAVNPKLFSNLAFYEAYFSNYIEGTTFHVDEAMDIVFHDAIIPLRIADTHDIKGTYAICSSMSQMMTIPKKANELISLLRERHSTLLSGRPEKNPGAFKLISNRARQSVFVEPKFVTGTIRAGFSIYETLQNPAARAIFMMFMISEIHPFDDGNGRIARLMMNAELAHAHQSKIIIPTVFREDYLLALRRLTRNRDASVYINMMIRAHAFSHWLDPVSLEHMQEQLELSNAFNESTDDDGVLRWE